MFNTIWTVGFWPMFLYRDSGAPRRFLAQHYLALRVRFHASQVTRYQLYLMFSLVFKEALWYMKKKGGF